MQDLRKLYIVMEYMPGGDLYHWMGILEDFSDEQTHFYAMEMVLAVEVLHNMGFLHRDLKPDNMLLDKNGHLKLADFGTCIRVQNGRVKTNFQVGTPDYICPEILRSASVHDLEVGFEIDWWAFGIVIYELFYGETPFEGESTSTLYQNIMCYKKTLVYPDDKPATPLFVDFISRILTEPADRMTVAQIKQHPYLNDSNRPWTFGTIRDHQSPVIFTVSGDDDTTNITFDANDRRNNISALFTNNNYFSGENLAFSGFTFNRNEKYSNRSQGNEQNRFELAELELVRQQLSMKLDSTSCELARSQAALGKMEKDLLEKEQIMSVKKNDYIVTLETNKQLRTRTEAMTKQNEALQREIDQVKAAIAEKEAAMRNAKMESANLADEVATLHGKVQAGEEKVGQLSGALEERQVQLEGLKKVDELLEDEKTRSQGLAVELRDKNRKICEYQCQLEEAQALLMKTPPPTVEDMNLLNNNVHEDLERLLNEKQKLEVRLAHLTDDFNDSEKLRTALQAELANEKLRKTEAEKIRDKLAKDVANHKIVVASIQNKLNSSEDQKRVLRQKINVVESEKDQMEQQKKMFESMVEVRKAENEGLVAELEEAEELFGKKEQEFDCERDALQGKLYTLVADLDLAKADSADKARQLEKLKLVTLENDHLCQQIDNYKRELEERKHDHAELSRITASQGDELDKNDKQMAQDKAKINALVSKIDEIAKNPKLMPQLVTRNKKKDTANADVSRKIKLLESELGKEKARFQEKCRELNEARNECQNWRDQNKELRAELEETGNAIKDLKGNLHGLMMQKGGGGGAGGAGGVAGGSVGEERSLELKCLEGRIDILKKGKGRHKIQWNASFASLKPFKLDIFQNEGDNTPVVSIDLKSVMHIREPSSAECVHIDKALLPQILQIIYEKQDAAAASDDIRRQSTIGGGTGGGSGGGAGDMSRRQMSSKSATLAGSFDESGAASMRSVSTLMSGSSLMLDTGPSQPLNGIYNIENHSFVPMRFRSYVNCDICHQSCSDLLNPPAALECGNCKKRIHLEHVSSSDYKIQWCQGAIEMMLLKVESRDAKFAWLNSLTQFKEYQKTNEIQIAPNTFYRSMRQPVAPHSPSSLSIP